MFIYIAHVYFIYRVCCSVLQRVAVCCSVLQCVAVRCRVLQCVAVCRSVLQCVAVCCCVYFIYRAVCCCVNCIYRAFACRLLPSTLCFSLQSIHKLVPVCSSSTSQCMMKRLLPSGHPRGSLASIRFCETQCLHFTTRVFGHSAISPFLGGPTSVRASSSSTKSLHVGGWKML